MSATAELTAVPGHIESKGTPARPIPQSWEIVPLGEAVEFLDSKRRPVRDIDRLRMQGSYPYYGASGIIDYVNDYLFDEDLILLGEDGENIISRMTPLAFRINGKTWVNNHAHVLRPRNGFDAGYLVEYLESIDYRQYNSGTAQPKLTQEVCTGIPVIQPPIEEQRAIAAALSDVDALIGALDKLIAKKRAIKLAAMQQLLTGRTRLAGFSGKWETKHIDELAEVDSESLPASTDPEFRFNYISLEDVEVGTIKAYTEQVFATAPSRARRVLRNGDAVLSTVRPNLQSHFVFTGQIPNAICSTGFAVLRPKPSSAIAAFVFFNLFTDLTTRQIEKILAGSNYPAINSSDVRRLEIPCPPIDEQKAIAGLLSDMDAEIVALERRREKTKMIKQGMMQELLTGRIRLL